MFMMSGVMVGRSVVENPFYWRHVDSVFAPATAQGDAVTPDTGPLAGATTSPAVSRRWVIGQYAKYATAVDAAYRGPGNVRLALAKPILSLFHGEPNGKRFRVNLHNLIRGQAVVGTGTVNSEEVLLSSAADVTLQQESVNPEGKGKKENPGQARAREKATKRNMRQLEAAYKEAALAKANSTPMGELIMLAVEVSNLEASSLDET
jgi:hypothetical protein